jgi:hypothetical protein
MKPADRAWIAAAITVTVYEITAVKLRWELLSEAVEPLPAQPSGGHRLRHRRSSPCTYSGAGRPGSTRWPHWRGCSTDERRGSGDRTNRVGPHGR